MDTIKKYEKLGFVGADVNLDIALYDYGMIWGKNEHCDKDQNMFVYNVQNTGESFEKQLFDFAYLSVEDIKGFLQEDWFNFEQFKSFMGLDKSLKEVLETYSNDSFFDLVYSMVQYYGYENIMGGVYNSFPIYKEDNFLTRIRYELLQRDGTVETEDIEEYLENTKRINYQKLEDMTGIFKDELKDLKCMICK